MNSKSPMRKTAVETSKRAAFIVVAAALVTLPLHGQQTAADTPTAASVSPDQQATGAPTAESEQEIIQELATMKKRIEQLEAALKQHEASRAADHRRSQRKGDLAAGTSSDSSTG